MTEKVTFYSDKGPAGDLTDPLNWIGGVVPNSTGTGVIEKMPSGTFDGTLDINNLMLLGSFTLTFAGTLDTVGVGSCQGLMVCDEATAIFAPTATLNDEHAFIVGNDDEGTFIAEGNATTQSVINSANTQIGRTNVGDGNVTIDDSLWTNTGFVVIGELGSGTVSVVDDSSVAFERNVFLGAHVGATGELAIASGGSVGVTGSLIIGGPSKVEFGTGEVTVGSDSSLTVGEALVIGGSSKLAMSGGVASAGVTAETLKVLAGGLITGYGTVTDSVGIVDDGIILATGGTLTIGGNVSGSGVIEIGADDTIQLTGSSIKPSAIDFIGSAGTLDLAQGAVVGAKIIGFAAGDIIAMASIDTVSFTASSGLLKLIDQGATVSTLHLVGAYSGDIFGVTQTTGGAEITLSHS